MAVPPDIRAEIARLEAMRPDASVDPEGFKAVNDEITRIIDRMRQWQAYGQRARKVV